MANLKKLLYLEWIRDWADLYALIGCMIIVGVPLILLTDILVFNMALHKYFGITPAVRFLLMFFSTVVLASLIPLVYLPKKKKPLDK